MENKQKRGLLVAFAQYVYSLKVEVSPEDNSSHRNYLVGNAASALEILAGDLAVKEQEDTSDGE